MSANLLLITLLVATSRASSDILSTFKALRFTQEPSSYVQFNPDFSQYTQAISICGWIKSLGSASYPTVFYYGSYSNAELTMLDDGGYICIFDSCMQLKGKFTVSKNTWFHTCVTWGASSRSHKYYVNGEMLGSKQTPSGRLLKTGQTLTLGNWRGDNSNHEFGGEMVNLNFYAKELTASEVKTMADDGMCINMVVDQHEEVRLLKWEEILKQLRSGTITEVDMTGTCAAPVNTLYSQLIEAQTKLNETAEKLLEVSTRLNETEKGLDRAVKELEKYNNTNNKWDWNIFLSEQFINQTVSPEQSEQIRTSWDDIAQKLVGFTITEDLIKFWKIVDCLETEGRPWSMLQSENYLNQVLTQDLAQQLTSTWDGVSERIAGVTMTKELVDLLNYVSEETNCYCGD